MSALQKDEEDVQAVSSVPHAQYPWQLKCCSQNGETKLYHMPEQDSASLYFAGAATAAIHLLLSGRDRNSICGALRMCLDYCLKSVSCMLPSPCSPA